MVTEQLGGDDQDLYDSIFSAALDMRAKAVQEPRDSWGIAISGMMMSILNGWERDPKNFPKRVVSEAWGMAYAWWELTGGNDEPALRSGEAV